MTFLNVPISKFADKRLIVHLTIGVAIGLSASITKLDRQVRGLKAEASTIVRATKVCSNCGHEKSVGDFHSKGDRTDARCRVCVSKLGKERRLEKKKLRLMKPRGRVLDLSEYVVTVISSQHPAPTEMLMSDWVDFTLGG